MMRAMLKGAAALAAAALPLASPQAANNHQAEYDADLSCAAYHLEIAGFYKSDLGRDNPRSDELIEQYRLKGTAKLGEALKHGAALGKDLEAVKT